MRELNVVCRLGGFHILMNYLGAIGTIMKGSGLMECLETCYGSVTPTHMMTGAHAKALRGHFLAAISGTVASGDKRLHVDSTVLFSRLLLLQREPNIG